MSIHPDDERDARLDEWERREGGQMESAERAREQDEAFIPGGVGEHDELREVVPAQARGDRGAPGVPAC